MKKSTHVECEICKNDSQNVFCGVQLCFKASQACSVSQRKLAWGASARGSGSQILDSKVFVETPVPEPHSWLWVADSLGLGWGLRICISNEFPGEAEAAGLRPHFESHCHRRRRRWLVDFGAKDGLKSIFQLPDLLHGPSYLNSQDDEATSIRCNR